MMRFKHYLLGVPVAVSMALGLTTFAPQPPSAAASSKTSSAKITSIVRQLDPAQTAGVYLSSDAKTPVVNVTTRQAAKKVGSVGLKSRIVKYSTEKLDAVKRALDQTGLVPGTAWSIDPKINKVSVTTDQTVTGAKMDKVQSIVSKFGAKVQIRSIRGTLRTLAAGGDAIWNGKTRCSLGFNVVHKNDPKKHAFLTAGHCGASSTSWTRDKGGQKQLGETVDSQFPGDDYARVDYVAGYIDYPSTAGGQHIDKAGTPTVGETVTRDGATSGTRQGEVTGLDATVQYRAGTVNDLIQTDVCAEPGDSGGPLYDGNTAYGLTSGGLGDCDSGGETFFQPVEEALNHYNVKIG